MSNFIAKVLAVADGRSATEDTIQSAVAIARTFKAQLDVLHVRVDPVSLEEVAVVPEMVLVAQPLEALRDALEKRYAAARQAYEKQRAPDVTMRWIEIEGDEYAVLAEEGKFTDLVVLGRPGADEDALSPVGVKAAILETGSPVMINPPGRTAMPVKRAVIAWNDSAQAARACRAALPLLEQATDVVVLTLGRDEKNPSVESLTHYLAAHGVKPRHDTAAAAHLSSRGRGRLLLQYAQDGGADLLVMGAYGHGRMTQFLGLGGATAKVVTGCKLPVLLAH